MRELMKVLSAAALFTVLAVAIGCTAKAPVTVPEKKDGHNLGGWWCGEHGIPEEECSMCSDKAYKEFKEKGDICPNHQDRAKSQCFICHPEQWEKYAARYKDKEGKDPPEPKKNMPKK